MNFSYHRGVFTEKSLITNSNSVFLLWFQMVFGSERSLFTLGNVEIITSGQISDCKTLKLRVFLSLRVMRRKTTIWKLFNPIVWLHFYCDMKNIFLLDFNFVILAQSLFLKAPLILLLYQSSWNSINTRLKILTK